MFAIGRLLAMETLAVRLIQASQPPFNPCIYILAHAFLLRILLGRTVLLPNQSLDFSRR